MSANVSKLRTRLSAFGLRFWIAILAVAVLIFAANFGYAAYLQGQENNARALTAELQVLSQQLATMPLSRILDITVRKPLHGRLLGFGHFCFESAAQEQGLRDIRYVGRPDARDLAIQRVVQRSGLRGPRHSSDMTGMGGMPR